METDPCACGWDSCDYTQTPPVLSGGRRASSHAIAVVGGLLKEAWVGGEMGVVPGGGEIVSSDAVLPVIQISGGPGSLGRPVS